MIFCVFPLKKKNICNHNNEIYLNVAKTIFLVTIKILVKTTKFTSNSDVFDFKIKFDKIILNLE